MKIYLDETRNLFHMIGEDQVDWIIPKGVYLLAQQNINGNMYIIFTPIVKDVDPVRIDRINFKITDLEDENGVFYTDVAGFLDEFGDFFNLSNLASGPIDVKLVTKGADGEDTEISSQYPVPADGDSVYVKDLDLDRSDNGDFSPLLGAEGEGDVSDYFNSLTTINCNATSDNPKIIKVQFQRTIQSSRIGFGCEDLTKGFGHVGDTITIKVIGSGSQIRTAATGTITNRNSFVIDFEPQSANGIIIEFNCDAEVCLSNLIIYKSVNVNAKIQAIQDNKQLVDVSATNNGNMKVAIQEYGDTPAIDAFDRLRTSSPFTIFDSKQLHDKQPLFWDEVVGGAATSTHNLVDADVEMIVTASVSDYVIRQTKQRFNYQPGKSALVFMTYHSPRVDGQTTRIGLFDGTGTNNLTPNNGIFFETNGTLTWNIAKNGSIPEIVSQENWNVDTLDGSGDANNSSGVMLDTDATQILIVDFEWLGVGRVRVGFVIDGIIRYVHYFNHANNAVFDSVYMSTPNLPLRYTIETDGSNPGELDHICSTIISEGGQQETGVLRVVDTGFTHIDASAADVTYAVLGIKLKDAYKDVTVIPEFLSMINEANDDFRWSVSINPTIAGTFTYTDLINSAVQGAQGTIANTVSDEGIVIASGYASIDTQQTNQTLNTALRIGSSIDGTPDELVLCVTPLSTGADIQGSINFRELL